MASAQQDNTTLAEKVALRRALLAELGPAPVVGETHGGIGQVYQACYSHLPAGWVLEKDPQKAAYLAQQRPTWAVYEGDSLPAVAGGVGAHLVVDLLDVDPYGEPWPILDAWFTSPRRHADRLALAVNDGLRQKVRIGGAWDVASLAGVVSKYGNRLADCYLEVCRELLSEKATGAGYRLDRFWGYYCGRGQQMTHYGAILVR